MVKKKIRSRNKRRCSGDKRRGGVEPEMVEKRDEENQEDGETGKGRRDEGKDGKG